MNWEDGLGVDDQVDLPHHVGVDGGGLREVGRPLNEHGHQHQCWAEEKQAASDVICN